jgi:valyl-tRNA synthetase
MKELPKQYNPKDFEERIYNMWEDRGLFHARVHADKEPYTIVIPPPNITGILHMGHALNNTIQDILIRYKKMRGYEVLWMPGTDHAGIATQNVVERNLAKRGKKRHDMGRDIFIEEVWKWQKEYGGTIIKQLRRLGASCDWSRERFTMDDGLSDAVLEVFVRLYDKGLIYRGNYIINWCPRCQTALSDEEAEHREIDGNLYYIKYPLKKTQSEDIDSKSGIDPKNLQNKDYIIVATTRPETMLGDTGLAVNPKDQRYKKLIESKVILPIVGREIIIVADDLVDPAFGTGVVKITPAHDPNDFQMGKKHGLAEINIMHPNGVLNENAGQFEGMDRFEARQALVELLKEKKLLEKIIPHKHSVGHCYRCHTIVEPYLSKQWFVKMKPLAGPAIDAVEKGEIKFYPSRWKKVYLEWMNNIRDWCISRQIWWGHRIPVYYCRVCQEKAQDHDLEIENQDLKTGSKNRNKKKITEPGVIVSKTKPERCPVCGSTDITQDPDVLDTWFSSWLWPFSTFGWPFLLADGVAGLPDAEKRKKDIEKQKNELKYFYPTSSLVTAQEIIFFWVARMIMAALEFCNQVPFRDVYIHGTVRDDTGTKMSKSLGNTIDPIDIIDEYGTDALRFSIISITAVGQDVFLSKDRFESGRNFANKLWNVSRFLLMHLSDGIRCHADYSNNKDDLALADRWILSVFNKTLESVEKALSDYRFNDAANLIYEFLWHRYCDWYVETAKARIDCALTQTILITILRKSLKMLHPFMPFVTEAIWQEISPGQSIVLSGWPKPEDISEQGSVQGMEKVIGVITAIRNIRADMLIDHKQKVEVIISSDDRKLAGIAAELDMYAKHLANTASVKIQKVTRRPRFSASCVLDFCELFVLLEGVIDINKERARLEKGLAQTENMLKAISSKLLNESFINKAPSHIIEAEREKEKIAKQKISRIKENIRNISK